MATQDAVRIPGQVELADLIMTYAIWGGREGIGMTAADRDCLDYLYCQEAADAIRNLLMQNDAPARSELTDLIMTRALYHGRADLDLDYVGRDSPDYQDCLIAADAIGALLRGEDHGER